MKSKKKDDRLPATLLRENHTKGTLKKEQRRTKLKKRLFLERFNTAAGNVSFICKQIKIGRKTYYEWLSNDPGFAEDILALKEELVDFGESQLFALMNDKNPAAVIFFLKTQGKDRGYVERQEMDHQGRIQATTNTTITVVHTREDNADIFKKVEKELKGR